LHTLAVTPGEPSGIGPDLCIDYAQQTHDFQLVLIADPDLIRDRARQLDRPVSLVLYDKNIIQPSGQGLLYYQPVSLVEPAVPGVLNVQNAAYILKTLDQSIQGCLDGLFDALVTGPIHKGIINQSGIVFTGHTEYLAEKTATEKVVMMLATDEMRVALATTHLPLKDVSTAITQDSLTEVIEILNDDLITKFGLKNPHILVCGLNPHAGEDGHLGIEELEKISASLHWQFLMDKMHWKGEI